MNTTSDFLEKAFSENNRLTPVQVVFTDVTAYSKRRSLTQTQIVDSLMEAVKGALSDTAKEYIDYAQKRDINFATDVITLPSGDGAAIVFPFDGIPDAHLTFSKQILLHIAEQRKTGDCPRFNEDGWCNCHPYFNLKIGVSEGRGILYKDLNGNYNLAGNVINMAARVMSQSGPNQILFTDEAFRQTIDTVEDPHLIDRFRTYENVRIKHNLRITLHQFFDADLAYINSDPVEDLELRRRSDKVMKMLGGPNADQIDLDKEKAIKAMESMAKAMKELGSPEEIFKKISGAAQEDKT